MTLCLACRVARSVTIGWFTAATSGAIRNMAFHDFDRRALDNVPVEIVVEWNAGIPQTL